ncbi:MAG: FAD-dependent oxidoreductase, partial [Halobacteriales archaeon]
LADAVDRERIETGARVTDLETAGGAVDGVAVEGDGRVQRHDVDGVVVATMPNVLEALTGYACDVDFQGTVCAVASLPEALTDTYWLNLADESRFGVLLEHTNFVPPSRYGGEHLVYLASYVQDDDELVWQLDDDALVDYWLDGIAALFPSFDPADVNWVRVARNPRTAPIYERGYLEKVVPYDLGDAVADGLAYAGMATRAQYPERSLNGAVEAGFAAAEALLDGPGG